MIVRVKLFAAFRQVARQDEMALDLPAGSTVDDVRQALARSVPALAELARHARFAIDQHYAGPDTVVQEGDDVACIPPVSGG